MRVLESFLVAVDVNFLPLYTSEIHLVDDTMPIFNCTTLDSNAKAVVTAPVTDKLNGFILSIKIPIWGRFKSHVVNMQWWM